MVGHETTRSTGTRMNPNSGEIEILGSNPATSPSLSSPYAHGASLRLVGASDDRGSAGSDPVASRASSTTPGLRFRPERSSSPTSTTSSPVAKTWPCAASLSPMSASPSPSPVTAAFRISWLPPEAPPGVSTP